LISTETAHFRRIEVSIKVHMTAGTSEDPHIQGHLLPMSTDAACLTRIGRIDFDQLSASFFRFARELTKECRPRGICNAFGKTVVVNHAVHLEVFYTDDPIGIDNLTTILMGEVLTPPGNPLMHASHDFAMLASLWSAFGKLSVLALRFGKSLFLFAEKARVLNLFTCGEGAPVPKPQRRDAPAIPVAEARGFTARFGKDICQL